MNGYLIKSSNIVRVEDKESADKLHKELEAQATEMGARLIQYKEDVKPIKEKGEIIDEYVIVSFTWEFNSKPADPEDFLLEEIQYKFRDSAF